MDKYSHFISIGYVCSVPALIFKLGKRKAAYPFDNMAIPMWAVTKLFENKFEGFFENMEICKLFEKSEEQFTIDSIYFARFSTPDLSIVTIAKTDVLRRVQRLLELLVRAEPAEPVLFIRCEERMEYPERGNRIIPPQFVNYYDKEEAQHLKDFSAILKRLYPQLNYKIIYLCASTDKLTDIDNINNIITLKCPHFDYRSTKIGTDLLNVFQIYKEFLDQNL